MKHSKGLNKVALTKQMGQGNRAAWSHFIFIALSLPFMLERK